VTALLAADADTLTGHDFASAATWADKYRDANINGSREKTSSTARASSTRPSGSNSIDE